MAVRVFNKHLLLALLIIILISSPAQARNTGEILRNRKLLVVETEQETRNSRQDGGGSDGYGLVDMDYNSANKKRPIHNR
ncbi:Protein GOLVEN 2 [Hirschfeldia incana]|nr:Protein GOLVEN 2 [Hirschfeldia incana]